MQSDQREVIEIDGSKTELDADWAKPSKKNSALRVLEKSAIEHPWVIGITAITFTAYQSANDWVSGLAVFSIFAITSFSVWNRRTRVHEKQNKPRRERQNQGSLVRPPG